MAWSSAPSTFQIRFQHLQKFRKKSFLMQLWRDSFNRTDLQKSISIFIWASHLAKIIVVIFAAGVFIVAGQRMNWTIEYLMSPRLRWANVLTTFPLPILDPSGRVLSSWNVLIGEWKTGRLTRCCSHSWWNVLQYPNPSRRTLSPSMVVGRCLDWVFEPMHRYCSERQRRYFEHYPWTGRNCLEFHLPKYCTVEHATMKRILPKRSLRNENSNSFTLDRVDSPWECCQRLKWSPFQRWWWTVVSAATAQTSLYEDRWKQ